MNPRFILSSASRLIFAKKGWAVLFLVCAALATPVFAAGGPERSAAELTKPGDPGTPRVSAERSEILPTSEGLTLRLTTDLGSVKITPLESGASPVVRCAVHIETDARAPLAQHLLDHYSLSAKSTPFGVEITGTLPPQLAHLGNIGAQFWVQFEVSVPASYSVEVKTEAGDIETQDIGGTAQLVTQGGNIRTGRIGTSTVHVAAGRAMAKLE